MLNKKPSLNAEPKKSVKTPNEVKEFVLSGIVPLSKGHYAYYKKIDTYRKIICTISGEKTIGFFLVIQENNNRALVTKHRTEEEAKRTLVSKVTAFLQRQRSFMLS